tara:strand:- start:97 stop:573 length:477 start_codon:yes stop_codon:yes gene_type:complete
MANSDLYGNKWTIPNTIISTMNKQLHKHKDNRSIKGYKRAYNIVVDRVMTYSMMKRLKNFFSSQTTKDDTYLLNGGDEMKTWVNNTLEKSRGDIVRSKRLKSDSGMVNQFKKNHEKDRENKNVTKVNLARTQTTAREILTNKTTYKEMIQKINNILKN